MQSNLFSGREHFKPFDYPICEEFCDAIGESYWTHKEWSFSEDKSEYFSEFSDNQREITKRCLLSISQVEVSIKTFFLKIGDYLPKPEFLMVGATFAESEVRHERAYSHLLEILGLNEDFAKIYEIPAIIDRMNYLKRYKDFLNGGTRENFLKSIILFSIFIENISLFNHFFILMSFNKHRKMLKHVNNAVAATSKEEQIHAQFGMYIINLIREESPDFFTSDLNEMVVDFCAKAYRAERKVLDWVFEGGDLDFIKKEEVLEFCRNRFNTSLEAIGFEPIFSTDKELLKKSKWFDEELHSDAHFDFFNQRPVSYSRKNKPINAEDLF